MGTSLLVLGIVWFGVDGCIRLEEDHCIVNGGDFACARDEICVAATEFIKDISDQGDGCVNENGDDRDGLFVHVKYGLPERLAATSSVADDDLQSVAGILARAVQDPRTGEDLCLVNENVVRRLEEEWLEIETVRDYLERRTRVRVDKAELRAEDIRAIAGFNMAIDHWLEGCRRSQ